MAEKHPYMSGAGGIVQTINQLRRSFPPHVTADTLKKLGIAPNNETYVLNILKFIGVLDEENKKSHDALGIFNKHDDVEFQDGFAKLIASSYSGLFELHGDASWSLSQDKLISYFRHTDHTSDVVGRRQASTFLALANIAGKSSEPLPAGASKAKRESPRTSNGATKAPKANKNLIVDGMQADSARPIAVTQGKAPSDQNYGMALTVRVEINLPAGGDQDTYDRIFKSIRTNLLNGDVT